MCDDLCNRPPTMLARLRTSPLMRPCAARLAHRSARLRGPRAGSTGARFSSSSSSSAGAADPEVLWPIGVGATCISAVLLGAFWLRNDKPIVRMHGWVQRIQRAGMTSENVTLGWLIRLGLAFGMTSVPVESLKVRQLRHGALATWSALLSSYDYEQQQIALGALCAVLEGDSALAAFWEEAGWFDSLVQSLPPLVHESSASLSQPEILYDALDLSTAIVSHPIFLHTHAGDVWLWERLLEETSACVPLHPEASLLWACLAATAAEKHEVAIAMLTNPEIKRALVQLADDPWTVPPKEGSMLGGEEWPAGWWRDASPEELESAYARLALHRLAQTADSSNETELSPDEIAERQEPFTHRYLHYTSPALPARPPPNALAPPDYERLASSLASVVFCGVGGAVWGGAAGMLLSNRARRPVWRSALVTMCGAVLLESLMQIKVAAFRSARASMSSPPATSGGGGNSMSAGATSVERFGGGPAPVPLYHSLRSLASGVSLDIAVSSSLLLGLIQPHRFPLAFGGWAIGRLACLSQEVELALSVYELVEDE